MTDPVSRLSEIATELRRQSHVVVNEAQLRALESLALDIDEVAAVLVPAVPLRVALSKAAPPLLCLSPPTRKIDHDDGRR